MKHTSLFLHPKKSSILWHDLKRDFVIMRGFAENLESGVYGTLPKEAIEPIHSMQDLSVRSLLLIENLMVLSKQEQGVFTITKEPVKLTEVMSEIHSFLKKRCPVKQAPNTLLLDRRYGRLLLENLIYTGYQMEESPAFEWSHSSFSLTFSSKLPMSLEELRALLFQENAPLPNEIILSLATAQILATAHHFSLKFVNTPSSTTLHLLYDEEE